MPTQLEIRAYTVGIRLCQALLISGAPGISVAEFLTLQAVVNRLRLAITELVSAPLFSADVLDRLQILTEHCVRQLETAPVDIFDPALKDAYEACHTQLAVIREVATGPQTNEEPTNTTLRTWFDLGMEIVHGWSGSRVPAWASRYTKGSNAWEFQNPDVVRELLDHLQLSMEVVMPVYDDDEPPDFPWLKGRSDIFFDWVQIEAGLVKLSQSATAAEVGSNPPPSKPDSNATEPYIPTAFQRRILEALNGQALMVGALARKVANGDSSRLYRDGLTELRKRKLVDRKNRLGYYRPDALPPELPKS